MRDQDFLKDFEKCELCEHRCKVNRLEGETGICKLTLPVVASATLHPAPPESYTVDLKAYQNETHLALTGAYAAPVLRNAEFIARHARNKLWEYRIVVIPKINEAEIQPLAEFIASIDPTLPVCFLAFRPNFVFENHPGATLGLMDRCVEIAKQSGLKNAYWSGHAGISGKILDIDFEMKQSYRSDEAQLAGSYAQAADCRTHPRNCSVCHSNLECKLKSYTPQKST